MITPALLLASQTGKSSDPTRVYVGAALPPLTKKDRRVCMVGVRDAWLPELNAMRGMLSIYMHA